LYGALASLCGVRGLGSHPGVLCSQGTPPQLAEAWLICHSLGLPEEQWPRMLGGQRRSWPRVTSVSPRQVSPLAPAA
jgi:hypothetical protein